MEKYRKYSDPESKNALANLISSEPNETLGTNPPGNVYAINDTLSAEGAADDYETCLKHLVQTGVIDKSSVSGFPKFDLMLVGMGPDGHVASLFPGHPLLKENQKWVTHIKDSPKPPPERITFTFPVINSSAYIALVVCGAGKASVVQTALGKNQNSEVFPVQMVSPDGELKWFLDKDAASKLENFVDAVVGRRWETPGGTVAGGGVNGRSSHNHIGRKTKTLERKDSKVESVRMVLVVFSGLNEREKRVDGGKGFDCERLREFKVAMKCILKYIEGGGKGEGSLEVFVSDGEIDCERIHRLVLREIRRLEDGLPIYADRQQILETIRSKQLYLSAYGIHSTKVSK
ncbi:unnamed protein product [Dovyalis caffra]|uniref:Glucosamine/galactosamine-6-phosphate isomerase domain-containing protein n=1 Tax=Dovyalis caffra TaxID=77055 RepID=A0AAV1QRA9_9ROSI|nr:unnamed protein product [Dovyalis caffra]